MIYLVWGSTYLAIRIMVDALPALLSAGIRFLVAGLLMVGFALACRHALPKSRRDWYVIAATGALMLIGANGLVTWSEQWVVSNQAALIVATAALWIAYLGSLGASGSKVTLLSAVGLLFGLFGVAVLVGDGLRLGSAPWYAYAALQVSAFFWALGSVIAKRFATACSPLMTAAQQTLLAGAVMTVAGLAVGDANRWRWEPDAIAALAYLIVFGTCIAYAVFLWLVHQVTPVQLGTYAFVNPAVAVLLGSWLLDEHLSAIQMAGTTIIIGSVALVTIASPAPIRKTS
ncbi:MAG: EamA family transporter [Panacagrimonas sp.]